MPSNVAIHRRRNAFNEGRRAARSTSQNPFDNPKLHELWERGKRLELVGAIKDAIPMRDGGKSASRRHGDPQQITVFVNKSFRRPARRNGQRERSDYHY
jgi:hypothetical protein